MIERAEDPSDPFARTWASLHAVAEHVLSAARYRATGRIGLVVVPGGIGTPPFGAGPTVVAIEAADLVVRSGAGVVAQGPITTLREAAKLADLGEPGGPADVYTLATPCEPDAPLFVDVGAASRIADWYAFGDAALRLWRDEIMATGPAEAAPSDVTVWPEHFDVAVRAGEVNYGAAPPDASVAAPYLYVGPPLPPPEAADAFWNVPFGAARSWSDISTITGAVAFFRAGQARTRSQNRL